MSIFSKVALRPPKKSLHDLSYSNKLSCNMGDLIPVLTQECYPGDVFKHSHQLFCQLAAMNSQVMQRFDLQVHYFFVPTRLIYADFEKFLVGGSDGLQTFVPPYFTPKMYRFNAFMNLSQDSTGKLPDYLGLPSNIGSTIAESGSTLRDEHLSVLPFRAYWKIYDDYFRDENLCPESLISIAGGEISVTEYMQMPNLLRRAWHKDYFTSALPWTQKGAEVVLPLGDKAPVKLDSDPSAFAGNLTTVDGETIDLTNSLGGTAVSSGIYADLANATGSTIDQLRTAEMVQEWLEKNARGGTRYNEQIFSHFGVRTPDSRLDRAEYICKGSSPITFGNVYSSTSNTNSNVQGFPVSTGQSQQSSGDFKYKVREHGYLMGILSIIPRAAYFQGINRKWYKNDKFDYYWPEFANLGEQAIYDKELFASPSIAPDSVFGYTPRYAEHKVNMDEIHGDFRNTLDFMHDARKFAASPTLSQQFIEVRPSNDDLSRIFNNINANNHKFYIDCYHFFRAKRPMPYFGTPMFHV